MGRCKASLPSPTDLCAVMGCDMTMLTKNGQTWFHCCCWSDGKRVINQCTPYNSSVFTGDRISVWLCYLRGILFNIITRFKKMKHCWIGTIVWKNEVFRLWMYFLLLFGKMWSYQRNIILFEWWMALWVMDRRTIRRKREGFYCYYVTILP